MKTVDESIALNDLRGPAVIISASGMATGGRVLHHLAHRLPDEKNTVILVGYQADGTRGRSLLDGAKSVKMLGRYVPVRAEVVNVPAFSVHADRARNNKLAARSAVAAQGRVRRSWRSGRGRIATRGNLEAARMERGRATASRAGDVSADWAVRCFASSVCYSIPCTST